MNSFVQLLLNKAARTAPVGFKAAAARVAPAVQDLTNPRTYQGLAARAENVLRRGLPAQFTGANFGNIPAQATGLINQVSEMPQGVARAVQSGMAARAIREMAGEAARLPAAAQQAASGALRAPVIGEATQAARQLATGLSGPLVGPRGFGGPFATDPALRREFLRQFGGTSQKAAEALAGVNKSGISRFLGPAAEAAGIAVAVPGAINAATSLYEAGEGIIRGGLGSENLRASLKRQNMPGYQPFKAPATEQGDISEFPTEPGPGWMFQARAQQLRRQAPEAPILPEPTGAAPGFGPAPIVRGTRDGVTPDRTQSDQYRAALSQYAQTPESQFQRYFQSPEMDQYFGAASRGKGAPESLPTIQALAAQTKAPTDTSLSTYYRAQSAAGRSNMPEIKKSLGYEKGSPLAQWAEANPMLAQRLYAQQQAKQGSTPSAAPEGAAEFGARAQSEGGYAGTFREQPGLFQAVGNPVVPTEDRGGSGLTQGERVAEGRGAPLLRAWQATKTTGSGMPNFPTTGQYYGSF